MKRLSTHELWRRSQERLRNDRPIEVIVRQVPKMFRTDNQHGGETGYASVSLPRVHFLERAI